MLPATPSLVAKRNPLMPRQPVPLEKAYRLINHGPTVMISAQHGGITNVMSASWLCALDYAPARVTVVIDKENYTRHLIEQSGWFGVQIPFAAQAETVITMGESRKDNPDKLRAVSLLPRRATTCRWSPTVPPGSSAASCRSRITRKPTTSLLAKSPPPGRTTASSVTAIGILTTSVTT